tara:strand:+ start:283 stop:468 length:186 start_codon:yes stop_codon:yes gene_type:complete
LNQIYDYFLHTIPNQFSGGDTDFRAFYSKGFDQVLGSSINEYLFVSIKEKKTNILNVEPYN